MIHTPNDTKLNSLIKIHYANISLQIIIHFLIFAVFIITQKKVAKKSEKNKKNSKIN